MKMEKINILYIHGFGSSYDPNSSKVKSLSKLGPVSGVSYDYTKPADENVKFLINHILENPDIDLIVGTSLGGWYAAEVGSRVGIPTVLVNPAIEPHKTLKKYLGKGVDWDGKEYHLTESVVSSYRDMTHKSAGLILLDDGDEVIPADGVFAKGYDSDHGVLKHEGGSHRFEHMEESLEEIESHYTGVLPIYGFGDN